MHIFFSGIGGTAIGPLAMIAKQAGYHVSGSDKQDSQYIHYLNSHGITDIATNQDANFIESVHKKQPIDWFVYSSAVAIEAPDSPEFGFCKEHGIKTSKRDELINLILKEKDLQLIAIAGTHGKTTTTAMVIWLFKQLGLPVSYSVGAKISYGDMGEYTEGSKCFIYEADEFDRNFLAFHPSLSIITGIDWDHPDIYPTRNEYESAFRDFVAQSDWTVFWRQDFTKLSLPENDHFLVLADEDAALESFTLKGLVNRKNALQVVQAVHGLTQVPVNVLVGHMNRFPGLSRRFEEIITGLYSDYAHTPEKIRGALQTAEEIANDKVVVIYEGLHNTRQHFIKQDLRELFSDVKKLYVVPSYLAREDPKLPTLLPQDIIKLMAHPEKAEAASLDDQLKEVIKTHLHASDLVLCLSAGGGGSLDEWLRKTFM